MGGSVVESVDIEAPVERAWASVSTSEGLSSWFVSAEVTPGPSGRITLRFGPGAEGTMPIQVWQPPHRIRFGAAEGEPGRAHDFQVAPVGGGVRVRVTDSGLEDSEMDAVRRGWVDFLTRLKAEAERAS